MNMENLSVKRLITTRSLSRCRENHQLTPLITTIPWNSFIQRICNSTGAWLRAKPVVADLLCIIQPSKNLLVSFSKTLKKRNFLLIFLSKKGYSLRKKWSSDSNSTWKISFSKGFTIIWRVNFYWINWAVR
jgi:hypothetical protein